MSMYARYVEERNGDSIIEHDHGFAIYRFINENQVYIVDIWIDPSMRKAGYASSLADKIAEKAKAKGCKEMIGTVVPSANGSTESLQVLLGYGMKLMSSERNLIIFYKGL